MDSGLTWSPINGLLVKTNRACDFEPLNISYIDAMHQYNWLVCNALQRDSVQDASQGLSGGTDSRHILLAMHSLGIQLPSFFTSHHYIDGLNDADVEIAHMLAKSLGAKITTVYPIADRFDAEIRKNKIVEFQSLDHSWGNNLADSLQDTEILYDGMNGGALFGQDVIVKFLRPQYNQTLLEWNEIKNAVISFFFDKKIDSLRQLISTDLLSEENTDAARILLESSIQKYKDYPNPFQAFRYYNHVARNTILFTYVMMKNGVVA